MSREEVTSIRCRARNKDGRRCRQWALQAPEAGEEGLCTTHAGRFRWSDPGGRQRCTAIKADGQRCRQWALAAPDETHEEGLCVAHAARTRMPKPRKGRRCTAKTQEGRRCRVWSVAGSDPPRCYQHEPTVPAARAGRKGRRCTATTQAGRRCKNGARRKDESDRPLCSIHAGLCRLPGPADDAAGRQCRATRPDGQQCGRWAVKDLDGPLPLCAMHAGKCNMRRVPNEADAAAGLRCTAGTLEGSRCRRWSIATTDPPLCWFHAYPDKHPGIRHGYYCAVPPLSDVEWEALRLCRAAGRPLDGEIVLARLMLRMVFDYLSSEVRPIATERGAITIIFRNVRAVARLLQAQQALAEDEAPVFPARPAAKRPDVAAGAASPLRTQAEALLAAARAEHVAEELAIVRVLLVRLCRTTQDKADVPVRRLFKDAELIYQGGNAAAALLRARRELEPDPQDQTQAIIYAALDELSEEWGVPL